MLKISVLPFRVESVEQQVGKQERGQVVDGKGALQAVGGGVPGGPDPARVVDQHLQPGIGVQRLARSGRLTDDPTEVCKRADYEGMLSLRMAVEPLLMRTKSVRSSPASSTTSQNAARPLCVKFRRNSTSGTHRHSVSRTEILKVVSPNFRIATSPTSNSHSSRCATSRRRSGAR